MYLVRNRSVWVTISEPHTEQFVKNSLSVALYGSASLRNAPHLATFSKAASNSAASVSKRVMPTLEPRRLPVHLLPLRPGPGFRFQPGKSQPLGR